MKYTLEEIISAKQLLAEIDARETFYRLVRMESRSMGPPQRLYRPQEIADIFDLSRKTIDSYRDKHKMPHSKESKVKFDLADVWQWMKSHRANHVSKMEPAMRMEIENLISGRSQMMG